MFEERATETELLDQPDCEFALALASYRFMAMVNTYFGGVRAVRRFLASDTATRYTDRPLHILDIGSGCCDIPLAVSRWTRARKLALHITCLELPGPAAQLAEEAVKQAGDPAVTVVRGDAFTHHPDQPYDYALSSMCFHHFSDAQILSLLNHLRGIVRSGVFINDLRRSRWASLAVRPLLLGWPAGVRHDALLSIRRGFKVEELKTLLQSLGDATVSVTPTHWFRVAATVKFTTGGPPCRPLSEA